MAPRIVFTCRLSLVSTRRLSLFHSCIGTNIVRIGRIGGPAQIPDRVHTSLQTQPGQSPQPRSIQHFTRRARAYSTALSGSNEIKSVEPTKVEAFFKHYEHQKYEGSGFVYSKEYSAEKNFDNLCETRGFGERRKRNLKAVLDAYVAKDAINRSKKIKEGLGGSDVQDNASKMKKGTGGEQPQKRDNPDNVDKYGALWNKNFFFFFRGRVALDSI